MAFTAQERDQLKAAVLALATGTRVASVAFVDRTISYQPSDLDQVRQLLAAAESDVAQANRPRAYRIVGSTGLE